jgi:F-type H+-transporting ATPase subunit epsilon
MHTFKLKILTPDEKLFEGEVESFVVPTQSGEITVLKNHAPLITLISIGEIKVNLKEGVHKFLVQGGVIDVKETSNFEVVILADQVVDTSVDNLDEEIKRAKEAMEMKKEEVDFAFEESTIERNIFLKRFKQR